METLTKYFLSLGLIPGKNAWTSKALFRTNSLKTPANKTKNIRAKNVSDTSGTGEPRLHARSKSQTRGP